MIDLAEFGNHGLDQFDETLLALPYVEKPGVIGDDGK